MNSTQEGEPETSRPRERPVFDHTPPAIIITSGSSTTGVTRAVRISAEGPVRRAVVPSAPRLAPLTPTPLPPDKDTSARRLLRHRLTSPEKRTVKRIQAQRVEYFTAPALSTTRPSSDLVRARVVQMLRDDRGLQEGLGNADAYEMLAGWLVDDALSGRTAAEIVGLFLREVGAMERPELRAPRVKSALRVLNELLYGDEQDGVIPQGVRELRLEKRDGGLQIVGVLRAGADEGRVQRACARALQAAGYTDVDVRLVSRR